MQVYLTNFPEQAAESTVLSLEVVLPFSHFLFFPRQGLWVAQAGLLALACPVLGSQASATTLSLARVRGKDVWLFPCVLKSFLFLLDSVVMDNRDALLFQC